MSFSSRGISASQLQWTLLTGAVLAAATMVALGLSFGSLEPVQLRPREVALDGGLERSHRAVLVCEGEDMVARVAICGVNQKLGDCLRPKGGALAAVLDGRLIVPSFAAEERMWCHLEPCEDFGTLCYEPANFHVPRRGRALQCDDASCDTDTPGVAPLRVR